VPGPEVAPAYAIFDAKNRFKKALVDRTKIKAFLSTLAPRSGNAKRHGSRA